MDFEPMRDVTFRGKRLDALTTDELREALCSALKRVRYLESIFSRPAPILGTAGGLQWHLMGKQNEALVMHTPARTRWAMQARSMA